MVESNLQYAIVRYLNRLPNTVARVNGPGPAHVVGDPDVYGCQDGRMFQIEVKQPKGRVSAAQEFRLKEWSEAGATCAVVTSLDQVKQLVSGMQGREG